MMYDVFDRLVPERLVFEKESRVGSFFILSPRARFGLPSLEKCTHRYTQCQRGGACSCVSIDPLKGRSNYSSSVTPFGSSFCLSAVVVDPEYWSAQQQRNNKAQTSHVNRFLTRATKRENKNMSNSKENSFATSLTDLRRSHEQANHSSFRALLPFCGRKKKSRYGRTALPAERRNPRNKKQQSTKKKIVRETTRHNLELKRHLARLQCQAQGIALQLLYEKKRKRFQM